MTTTCTTLAIWLFQTVLMAQSPISATSELRDALKPRPQEKTFTLPMGKVGMEFEDFVEAYAKITGKQVFYDVRKVQNKRIKGAGDMTFKVSDAEEVFQGLFVINDFVVMEISPDLGLYMIDDLRTSQHVKMRARVVPVDQIGTAVRRPAEVVSTVIPLQHARADTLQRTLQMMISEHRVGLVTPADDANALLVVGLGPAVASQVKLIRTLDAAAGTETAKKHRESRRRGPQGR